MKLCGKVSGRKLNYEKGESNGANGTRVYHSLMWQVYSTITVKGASSLTDAIEQAEAAIDHIPLPRKCEYVDGSFELNTDDLDEYKPTKIGEVTLTIQNGKCIILK